MRSKIAMISIALIAVAVMGTLAPAQAQKLHKEVKIDILGMGFGTNGYVTAFALADVINKNSQWLRATAVETTGTIENARILQEQKEKRKSTVSYMSLGARSKAMTGSPPFKSSYNGMKSISLVFGVVGAFWTLNPDIKTEQDLIGKRIAVGSKGGTSALWPESIIRHGWGIGEKVKSIEYLGYKGGADALRSGRVDAMFVNVTVGRPDKLWNIPPALRELLESVQKIYFIAVPPEVVDRARKNSGLPLYPSVLPAGRLGSKQPHRVTGYSYRLGWWADTELPDEIAYEICRVIYENYEKLWTYTTALAGLNPKTMATASGDEKDWHPGAAKFYGEKGIKIR